MSSKCLKKTLISAFLWFKCFGCALLTGRHVGGLGLNEFGGDAAGLADGFRQYGPAHRDSPGFPLQALKRIALRVGHPIDGVAGLDPYGVFGDQAIALSVVHR